MEDYEHTDVDGDRIHISVSHLMGQALVKQSGLLGEVYVPRDHAEAVASAVAGEPVILIKESELPEVKVTERGWLSVDGYIFDQAEDIEDTRKEGLAYLAAARYLESQKKREDEELDELAKELQSSFNDGSLGSLDETWRAVARKAKELLAE